MKHMEKSLGTCNVLAEAGSQPRRARTHFPLDYTVRVLQLPQAPPLPITHFSLLLTFTVCLAPDNM